MQALRLSLLLFLLVPVTAGATPNDPPPLPVTSAQPVAPGQANTSSQAANVPQQMQATIVHMQAAFEAQQAQMAVAENALRVQLLGLLTPAQRSFVAATVGELAVAPNPDASDAARRLDATFSPGQRQAVAGLMQAMQARAEAIFAQTIAQSQSEMQASVSAKSSVAVSGGVMPIGAMVGAPPLAIGVQGGGPGMHIQGQVLPGTMSGGPETQSAGALVMEILMTGSMESLHTAPTLIRQK